jgi:hypothetical protein
MTTWQFNLFFLQQVIKIISHLAMSNVYRISSYWLLEVGFKVQHTNGLDLDPQLHSATHMSASSLSDVLLLYSTVLT